MQNEIITRADNYRVNVQGADGLNASEKYARLLCFIISVGLVFFSFNVVTPRWEVLWLYDSKRIFVCALVIISSLTYVISSAVREQAITMFVGLSRPTKIALGCLFGAMLFANLFGEHFLAGHIQFFYLIGLVLLSVLLGPFLARNKAQFFRLCVLINILLFLSVAVMFWGMTLTGHEVTIFSLFGFVNPRFLNHIQVWIFISIAYLAVTDMRRGKAGAVVRISLMLLFATSFATDARGVLLSMSIGFVLLCCFDKANRAIWFKIFWQSLLFGYVFKYVCLSPMPMIWFGEIGNVSVDPQVRVTSSGRLDMWIEIISSVSLFGYGGDKYACEGLAVAGPHNSFLNVLYHWGIVALGAYVTLVGLLVNKLRKIQHCLTLAIGITLISAVTYSFFTGLLVTPLSQVFAVCLLGLFWGQTRHHQPVTKPKYACQAHISLIVISIISILLVGYRLELRINNYPELEQEMVYKPQFWLGYNCLSKPELP